MIKGRHGWRLGTIALGLVVGFLTLSCNTQKPVERFPPRSAVYMDRTGKRWVEPFFLKSGDLPNPETGAGGAPRKESLTPEEAGYKPDPYAIEPSLSEDGTYRTVMDFPIPVRDNTHLVTDCYIPLKEGGPYPVILERTPRDRKGSRYTQVLGPLFAKAGFIFAVQNVRGLFGSEGTFFPFQYEAADGRDVHKWFAAQSWFSGALGATGSGYSAYAACLAASDSSSLKAMILENFPSDIFMDGGYYMEGVPMTACLHSEVAWRLLEYPNLMENLRWDDALFHLPLNEMDNILGHPLPFWDECLRHPSYNYFWEDLSLQKRYARIDAAVLHIGGWYCQQDLGGVVTSFSAMEAADRERGRAGRQALVVGPWSKGINSESFLGFCDFTNSCLIDESALYLSWFNKWLKEKPPPKETPSSLVRLFVLGTNEWRDCSAWPPEAIAYEPYFIHSDGHAGEGWGLGKITLDPPVGFEEIDSFLNNPTDPVLSELELGTDDQRPVEQRVDVLTYTSEPLEQDLLVIGSAQAVIHANTLAPDTDLFVMLTDVDEFGFSRPVAFGMARTRFRDSFQAPTPVSPDEIHTYIIDLTPTANRFLKGHALRLNIMGSYFPFITRNLNTGSDIGTDIQTQEAAVFVLHDFDYPSRIMLPVLFEEGSDQ